MKDNQLVVIFLNAVMGTKIHGFWLRISVYDFRGPRAEIGAFTVFVSVGSTPMYVRILLRDASWPR
ncbi:hypothetical protein BGX38DRAFT_1204120 [Terfezia claveryi]|nr:hypothetical protein BGX38DRAFT_1204120 [Terfezia claveryi]